MPPSWALLESSSSSPSTLVFVTVWLVGVQRQNHVGPDPTCRSEPLGWGGGLRAARLLLPHCWGFSSTRRLSPQPPGSAPLPAAHPWPFLWGSSDTGRRHSAAKHQRLPSSCHLYLEIYFHLLTGTLLPPLCWLAMTPGTPGLRGGAREGLRCSGEPQPLHAGHARDCCSRQVTCGFAVLSRITSRALGGGEGNQVNSLPEFSVNTRSGKAVGTPLPPYDRAGQECPHMRLFPIAFGGTVWHSPTVAYCRTGSAGGQGAQGGVEAGGLEVEQLYQFS